MGFILEFAGSFFGAVGGAIAILLIDYRNKQTHILSTINALIAIIGSNMNTLLAFKRQHALPHQEELKQIMQNIESGPDQDGVIKIEFTTSLNTIHVPEFEKDYPIKDVSTLTYQNTALVESLTKSKHYLRETQSIAAAKNELVTEMRLDPLPIMQKAFKYLGFEQNNADTRLLGITNNLVHCIDTALFFNKRAIELLTMTAKQVLPARWHNKIATYTILDEYQDLLPSDDYIEGYTKF